MRYPITTAEMDYQQEMFRNITLITPATKYGNAWSAFAGTMGISPPEAEGLARQRAKNDQ
jgi:hypothetical protein